ncbi:NFX1-type zinc finger-containing protein 1-like [Ptychodera flava]|uniref:NFX1-type zinc finger-containing protein 1-like n=1 Tax=Ptychodera flava TaxID=63121 RepID=UPI003969C077
MSGARPKRGRGAGLYNRRNFPSRNGSRRSEAGDQAPRQPCKVGYHQLRKIVGMKNSSDKMCEIMRVKDGLISLLNSDSIRETGILSTFIEILSSVCSTGTMTQNLLVLLNSIQSTMFWKKNLCVFLTTMRSEESADETDKYPQLIKHIISIFQEMLDRLDTIDFPIDDLDETVRRLIARYVITDNNIVQSMKTLREARQRKLEMMARPPTDSNHHDRPPNDFRQIPIFPTPETLTSDDFTFLRKNKVVGGYSDVEEYLDIQFRLLHQDFLLPLREAIKDLAGHTELLPRRGGRKIRRTQDARVYSDIKILSTGGTESGIVYTIYIGRKISKRIKWETSRRLLNGALVCLSSDGFHQQLLLGTVYQRDPERLRKGLVEILFEGETEEGLAREMDYTVPLQMIETSAYFESYRHVLKRLQELDPETMPFKDYFLKPCRGVVIKTPEFLNYHDDCMFDIEVLFKEKSETGREKIDIYDDAQWPNSCDIGCDNSQSEAVKHALRSELALIQGPPGTGKTYIGLRIMETLLENSNLWLSDEEDPSPILVLCYTNHALDQFLEGILAFLHDNIIRIGGRCKSDRVKPFRLKNVRDRIRLNSKVRHDIYKARSIAFRELGTLAREIEETISFLNLPLFNILHEDTLKDFMGGQHYQSLLYKWLHSGQGSVLFQWLAVGRSGLVKGNTISTSDLTGVQRGFNKYNDDILDMINDTDSDTDSNDHSTGSDNYSGSTPEGEFIGVEDEAYTKDALRVDEGDSLHTGEALDDKPAPLNSVSLAEATVNALPKHEVGKIEGLASCAWQVAGSRKHNYKTFEKELYGTDYMTNEDAEKIKDVWELRSETDKWKLYRNWVKKFTNHYMSKKVELDEKYCQAFKRYQEILTQEDRVILQGAKVIGMTTTGASKYHSLLQEIKPNIVMIEEAAEIFEAHIISALTSECKQLILIGDHQQLRPTPTVHKLAKDYNLDVSLFERLIRLRIPFKQLSHQHRMRPAIAKYMHHIYPELQNADVVKNYGNVKGVKDNIFFISHEVAEEENDQDTTTHVNQHEASFIVELCRYLIRQGYRRQQITILTAYSGQLHVIQYKMPKEEFEGVRVTTIDNFQGEENDIILLSLVRSNEEEKVGFLKVDNRICVALSRAKIGLYCIGNLDNLTLNSELWSKVIADAKKINETGPSLPLVCQCHPDHVTYVSQSSDFNLVPLGGCGKPCQSKLSCGHECPRPCHPLDREHSAITCKHDCMKVVCDQGHTCSNKCGVPCDVTCKTKVEKVMPQCGHTQEVECGSDLSSFSCKYPCEITLPCGHLQNVPCATKDSVEIECKELVTEVFKCGHTQNRQCFVPKDEFQCPEPCKAILRCGHKCQGSCSKCTEGHQVCKQICGKLLFCNHKCEGECNQSCRPCPKPCEQFCLYHRWKCNKLCDRPCTPCNRPCTWQCSHGRCTKQCGEICNKIPCNYPCKKIIRECKHLCLGLCGETCICLCTILADQPDIKAKSKNVTDRFVRLDDCGHIFEVNYLDAYMSSMSTSRSNFRPVHHIPCPYTRCGIPIRNCRRYGKITKTIVLTLNSVKREMFQLWKGILSTRDNLARELQAFSNQIACRHEKDQGDNSFFLRRLKASTIRQPTPEVMIKSQNQFNLFKFVKQLMWSTEKRSDHANSSVSNSALKDVTRDLEAVATTVRRMTSTGDDRKAILEQCHHIRLLMEIEVIDDKLCRTARDRITSKNPTLSEDQTQLLCCRDDDVKRVRAKLKDLVWQLESAVASDDLQSKVQDAIDELSEDYFGRAENNIYGREIKLNQPLGGISGRWWICPSGHRFAETELDLERYRPDNFPCQKCRSDISA